MNAEGEGILRVRLQFPEDHGGLRMRRQCALPRPTGGISKELTDAMVYHDTPASLEETAELLLPEFEPTLLKIEDLLE